MTKPSIKNWSRRDFLAFISTSSTLPLLTSCLDAKSEYGGLSNVEIQELKGAIRKDEVSLSPGLDYHVVVKEGDSLGQGLHFGTNNDYLNFYTFSDGKTALWCNHENVYPLLVHNRKMNKAPTKKQLKHEREQVGGSFVEVTKNDNGQWSYVEGSDLNFRLSGNTTIALSEKIRGKNTALGTLANCSGGYTPWGTILTCEENYQHFYGERENGELKLSKKYDLKWMEVDSQPTEHYGWVVEVNPIKKTAEKIISLGRFSHECATVALNNEGYPIVYSGDDCEDECLYKFISSDKKSLKKGTLYVAKLDKDTGKGEWLSLDYKKSKALQKNFKSQKDVLINCRKAAKIVGATPLDRPEDIEQDPINGDIFITLTNNKSKGNYHGSILKISEENKSDLDFRHSIFRAGGTEAGFSCPDNMAFDQNGNFWMTSDISGGSIGKSPYESFGNNGLFVVPRFGSQAGKILKVASAPIDAEFTGPFFSTDQKTLFLSVQHPGEKTKDLSNMTSHWPSGDKSQKPLSSVIAIQGSLLDSLTKKA